MAYIRRTEEQEQALLAAWRASGIGLNRFARENGLAPKSLREWNARWPVRPAFLPVRVVPPARASGLVVQLAGCGHRIEVPSDFDAVSLRRLVEALC